MGILLAVPLLLKAQLASIPYENGIYKISTPNHLKYLSIAVQNNEATEGKTFYLMNDINMAGIDDFTPIGGWSNDSTNSEKKFSGSFNGNMHKITNLTIHKDRKDCIGVFGKISYALIENLIVENGNLKGSSHIGGLVGEAHNSTIRDCHTEIQGDATFRWLGGLAGLLYGTTVSHCSSFSTLKAGIGNDGTGGLIGSAWKSTIFESYAKGIILDMSSNSGYSHIGGFIGSVAQSPISTIKNCYSRTGIVSTNTHSWSGVGGFIGDGEHVTIINNCYAVPAEFTTVNSCAGLFGGHSLHSVKNCYYSTAISVYKGVGCHEDQYYPPLNSLFAKSDEELRFSSMVAFPGNEGSSLNFENATPVWAQDLTSINDGFPVLRCQLTVGITEPVVSTVTVFPNPTAGKLRIKNYELLITNIDIFDVSGRFLSSLTSQLSHEAILDISHLSSGIYFLQIQTEKGIITEKVIKL